MSSDSGTGGTTVGGEATFTRVRDEILTPSCALSGCHAVGAPAANGFELPVGGEHAAIVGVESSVEGYPYVVAGDADGSYFILKMEGAVGIVGSSMPLANPLDPAEITLFRDWIDAGALDN